MLENVSPTKVLFLDIETAPISPKYSELDEEFKFLWDKKSEYFREDQSAEDIWLKSAVYSEFAKVICISVAALYKEGDFYKMKVKSVYDDNEKNMLEVFSNMLIDYKKKKDYLLCAHNGKEFDFPFLARRMLINRIKLPEVLDIAGQKPWEVNLLDTMNLWKFGDYKHYTSLELLAAVFGLKSPKADIEGSMVPSLYWEGGNMERIRSYCSKDAATVANLFLVYKGINPIDENDIIYV